MKRKELPEPHFIQLNDIPPRETFVLNSVNLQWWVITPQDEIVVEFANWPGPNQRLLVHPSNFSDTWFAEHPSFLPVPVFVTWRRGFYNGAVISILNLSDQKLRGVAVANAKGKTNLQYDMEPGGKLEIGHLELSNSENLQAGELFEIHAPGFIPVWGVILDDSGASQGGSTAGTVLKAAGAIGLGALGAFLGS